MLANSLTSFTERLTSCSAKSFNSAIFLSFNKIFKNIIV
jgi:hypothetical protein